MLWLGPLLALSGIVHAWGMFASPQRVDDEGTYVAQAYAVEKFGELAHYTYWYDHPPLGWLQLALWSTLTDWFGGSLSAVMVGRAAMLVVQLACVVLLWLLGRRLGMSRPAAATAVLLFSLSPLDIYFHRMVYLDNIAVVWMLAAFVLATARRHQLAAFNGAAACFAIAVLSKETAVLWLPPLVWLIWRHAHRATRRYTLAVSGALFALLTSAYLVYALLKNELIPGPHHVSLIGGIEYQLLKRKSSGEFWSPHTGSNQTVIDWLRLDWVTPILALLGLVPTLLVRRLWPIAAALLLPVVLMLRPGYLPIPYAIAILPFLALVAAAGLETCWRRRVLKPVVVAVTAATVLGCSLTWGNGYDLLMGSDQDRPMAQAESWLEGHVGSHQRMLVDDAVWVDLVQHGFPRNDVIWYFKADTDPAVKALAPRGWRDYQYLMVTESVRRTVGVESGRTSQYGEVTQAYRHSHVVASFGSGQQNVEVRRISPRSHPGAGDRRTRPASSRPSVHAGALAASVAAGALSSGSRPAPAPSTVPAATGSAPATPPPAVHPGRTAPPPGGPARVHQAAPPQARPAEPSHAHHRPHRTRHPSRPANHSRPHQARPHRRHSLLAPVSRILNDVLGGHRR